MKFLFLLNPLKSRSREFRNNALLKAVPEMGRQRRSGAPSEVRVCAPGIETRALAQGALSEPEAVLIPPIADEGTLHEALGELQARTPDVISRQIAFYRGEGPAAEALRNLLRKIHDEIFDFDALVSTLPAPLLDRTAAGVGALSVRMELWPGVWGRWRDTGIVRCRNAQGIDPLEALSIADLREIGLYEVPASVDQRLEGVQPLVNPFESRFAPLEEDLARAFRPDRKTALLVPQTASDAASIGGNAFPDAGAFLDAALPPLLDAGWRCLLIAESGAGQQLAGVWADCEGVFLTDEGSEHELKAERRKILALLAQADLVVTDNSPTGLEALIYERPVCVLGRPFFALRDAFPELHAVASGDFDETRYREAGSLIRAFFLRAHRTPFFGPDVDRSLSDRIQGIADLTHRFGDRPRRWARAVSDRFGKPDQARWQQAMRKVHARLERFPGD